LVVKRGRYHCTSERKKKTWKDMGKKRKTPQQYSLDKGNHSAIHRKGKVGREQGSLRDFPQTAQEGEGKSRRTIRRKERRAQGTN